ncbi:hypothetical protein UFOVP152_47 [uncultured Caudovirales phage]|uniref:Uncharacterized protein n=1 Tax=uncultured Caudovirales phage TaxID=2100421 RepID=A0A6J7W9D8_9CAUD|nr:hypothetical protein UFOVP152_47 [uncultured Caudovirales phage]
MSIKYTPNYGYAPPSPFWIVWNSKGLIPGQEKLTKEEAEEQASRLACRHVGELFHVMAVIATVCTSVEVVGEEFDPFRKKPVEAILLDEVVEDVPEGILSANPPAEVF